MTAIVQTCGTEDQRPGGQRGWSSLEDRESEEEEEDDAEMEVKMEVSIILWYRVLCRILYGIAATLNRIYIQIKEQENDKMNLVLFKRPSLYAVL